MDQGGRAFASKFGIQISIKSGILRLCPCGDHLFDLRFEEKEKDHGKAALKFYSPL